jgi:hypothetical protein
MLIAHRESARKAQCQLNLKQLALACINHESSFFAFPSAVANFSAGNHWISTSKEHGMTLAGPNWSLQILSQLGEDKMLLAVVNYVERRTNQFNVADDWEQLGTGVGSFGSTGTPDFMICPAALPTRLPHASLRTQLENLDKGNYAACLGSGTYLEGIDRSIEVDRMLNIRPAADWGASKGTHRVPKRGIMTVSVQRVPIRSPNSCPGGIWQLGHGKGVHLRRIRDGASKTVLLSEVLTVDGQGSITGASDDIRGVWVSPSMGASTYSHKTTPNSTVKDRINGCELDAKDLPAKSRLSCVEQPATGPTAGDTFAAARSQHRGGVNAATADGAVRFYANEIDPDVWAALGTRADND